jgi:hypothetical protein
MMTAGVTGRPVWDLDLELCEIVRTLPLDSNFRGNSRDDVNLKGETPVMPEPVL